MAPYHESRVQAINIRHMSALSAVHVTTPQSPLSAYTLRVNNARVHSVFQSAQKVGLIDVTWRVVIYLHEICSKKARTKVYTNSLSVRQTNFTIFHKG